MLRVALTIAIAIAIAILVCRQEEQTPDSPLCTNITLFHFQFGGIASICKNL
jgi:hypothetical protein